MDEKAVGRLGEIDRELNLLGHASALLSWDQETYMPAQAVGERSEQLALLQGLIHDRTSSTELGSLLDRLGSTAENPVDSRGLDPNTRSRRSRL
jgi:carboxypeptidase Taq